MWGGISSFDRTASPSVKPLEYATQSVTAMKRRGCEATTMRAATATPTSSSGGPPHLGWGGSSLRTGGLPFLVARTYATQGGRLMPSRCRVEYHHDLRRQRRESTRSTAIRF